MRRIHKIKSIVNRIGAGMSIVIIQFHDLVLAYGLCKGQRGADRIGMERIVIILIDREGGVKLIEIGPREIIPAAIIDIGRSVDIEGKGLEIPWKFMPERKIRAVHIVSGIGAGIIGIDRIDGRSVLIYLEGI
jgi:hypothetical protein